jgi:Xaa-Pro aminopeptidase
MIKNTLLPVQEFTQRRTRFLQTMPNNSVALFPAGTEVTRSNDTEFPFCQNKNFYYLTGFNEPDAVLALVKNTNTEQAILFCREKNPLQEIWQGRRVGPELAKSDYQFHQCFVLSELNEQLPVLLADIHEVHCCIGENSEFDQQILTWISQVKGKSRQGINAPTKLIDCAEIIHDMRLIKSDAELAIMRQVNIISGQAHQRAMQKSAVGKFEYQIEAEILHEFARHGARYPAYTSIVAGGNNANILHYTANDDTLENNQLLLIDAGGELAGYAADITRTFPINGKFTEPQKQLYQLVLNAQNLAIAAIKPGMTLGKLNDIANECLTKGLLQLGLLSGDFSTLMAEKASKQYFIHGLGHWLGLDVHDVGNYYIDEHKRQSRAFEVGMVMTIEPGLYVPLDDTRVDEKWRGIGIRIEDNIAVTEQGYENLTSNSPKTIDDIERLMADKSALI